MRGDSLCGFIRKRRGLARSPSGPPAPCLAAKPGAGPLHAHQYGPAIRAGPPGCARCESLRRALPRSSGIARRAGPVAPLRRGTPSPPRRSGRAPRGRWHIRCGIGPAPDDEAGLWDIPSPSARTGPAPRGRLIPEQGANVAGAHQGPRRLTPQVRVRAGLAGGELFVDVQSLLQQRAADALVGVVQGAGENLDKAGRGGDEESSVEQVAVAPDPWPLGGEDPLARWTPDASPDGEHIRRKGGPAPLVLWPLTPTGVVPAWPLTEPLPKEPNDQGALSQPRNDDYLAEPGPKEPVPSVLIALALAPPFCSEIHHVAGPSGCPARILPAAVPSSWWRGASVHVRYYRQIRHVRCRRSVLTLFALLP
jgi:hypothetical protein